MLQAQPAQGKMRFLRWGYQDALSLAGMAGPRTPLYLAGTGALLLQVSRNDPGTNPWLQRADRGAFGQFLDFSNHFGGPNMNLPVAALFVVSLGTRNQRFQDAAFTSLQSMLYAGAISYGLKYAFGRSRPYDEAGPGQFRPFSGRTSFPSGHTTTAFAVLTPWVLYYPHPVTYGLFGVATGTAMARLARDKHWLSDVVAGGMLGYLTAYWLTRQHQGRTARLHITPSLSPDALSLAFRMEL
jgi:membrane-associated phospholipid phosphatase